MRRIQSGYQVVGVIGAIILCTISNRGFAAPAVIGNWEDGQADGWIDWGNGQTSIAAPRFGFNSTGATVGTGAIQFNITSPGTYTQWAAFKLQSFGDGRGTGSDGPNPVDYRQAFMGNTKFAFDLTLVPSEQNTSDPSFNFSSIGVFLNAPGWGFNRLGTLIPDDQNDNRFPESITPAFAGYNVGTNGWNPTMLDTTQTSTWVYDYSAAKAAITPLQNPDGDFSDNGAVDIADYTTWRDHLGATTAGGYTLMHEFGQSTGIVDAADYNFWKSRYGDKQVPQYVEFIFELYTQGPAVYHIDNVRLFTPGGGSGSLSGGSVPEPGTSLLALIALGGMAAIRRQHA